MLESLLNKNTGLKVCNSIKKTSTQVFSCEICKFSKNTFFTEPLQWLFLRFNSCFQRSPDQKPVRLSLVNTIFSCKKVFAAAATVDGSVKESLQLYY